MQFVHSSDVFITYFFWFSIVYFSLKILFFLWTLIRNYIVPIFKKSINFKQYGQWAVITGGTDGIGKEFAIELASKGVDVCLISRNEEKLINTAKEIGDSYGVKTKYIVADFTNTDIYDNIRQNLDEIDVGILVNNVGTNAGHFAPFSERKEQLIRDHINVNMLSLTMMTHIVLPSMIAKKRGLIINMSSLFAEIPFSTMTLYCSTKAFMTMFGKCVSRGLKEHNVQMVTINAGVIVTKLSLLYPNMMSLFKKVFPFFVITADTFVKSIFVILRSGTNINYGYFSHHIYGLLGRCFPVSLLEKIATYIEKP